MKQTKKQQQNTKEENPSDFVEKNQFNFLFWHFGIRWIEFSRLVKYIISCNYETC